MLKKFIVDEIGKVCLIMSNGPRGARYRFVSVGCGGVRWVFALTSRNSLLIKLLSGVGCLGIKKPFLG